jgi:hypothetical protein
MTVANPNAFYQVDFVCGPVIHKFGQEGSNIFYTPQGRLISADNDGDNPASSTALKSFALIAGGSVNSDNIQFNVASDPSKIAVVMNGTTVGLVSFGSSARCRHGTERVGLWRQ